MLQCGADYYENLTNEKVDTLLDKLASVKEHSTYMRSNRQEI
jgi:NADH-quinone oxidoreductase subunit E